MRFLVDAQLPPALARMIAAKGFEAEHVCDVQLDAAADRVVWEYALKRQAAILTKDEDFVSLITLHPEGPAIVWIRIGNTSRQALIRWFEPLLPAIVTALQNGEKLIEVV
jgi:predicted nuclease of predicted toxin-antitoxin system